jgi:lipoyl-dependent peroxiredoxin
VWHGDVRIGQDSISTETKVLDKAQYSFNTRFASGIRTNPEELLAAAHTVNCAAVYPLASFGENRTAKFVKMFCDGAFHTA